jgi:ribosomal protein S12 methylthiotransferase accessory factor
LPNDRPILWIEGRDATDGQVRWLPLEVVSTDYRLPQPPGSGVFQATTNGLALGNTFDEACLHGTCELIERDATTLWHLGGEAARARTRLDLATIDDALVLDLLERFARAGVEIAVWETTSDVGVACFVALVAGRDSEADPEIGAGCHPARDVALCRALTEAAQARVGFISGTRDDLFPALYAPAARRRRAIQAQAWLREPARGRRFGEVSDLAADSPAVDLAQVLGRLRTAGLDEVVMVDLTKPAIGLPVVRVVVPGLAGPSGEGTGAQARAAYGT